MIGMIAVSACLLCCLLALASLAATLLLLAAALQRACCLHSVLSSSELMPPPPTTSSSYLSLCCNFDMLWLWQSIGLIVAIFVSDVAFTDKGLQGDAKLGALLSAMMAFVCIGVARFHNFSEEDVNGQVAIVPALHSVP